MAMHAHSHVPEVQIRGATALAQAATASVECHSSVINAGAPRALGNHQQWYQLSPPLLPRLPVPQLVVTMVDTPVFATVDAVSIHLEKSMLVERAVAAFAVVASGDKKCKDALLNASAVSTVSDAMLRHSNRVQLQLHGLIALVHLSDGNFAAKGAVVAGKGPIAAAGAMTVHVANLRIQQLGCSLINNLANGGAQCTSALASSGCVRRLTVAFERSVLSCTPHATCDAP